MAYTLTHIKILLCIVILCGATTEFQAQETSGYRIMRSNLGSSGSSQSVVTSRGSYIVSQSIGQSSVIGTHSKNGYYLRQGYQQPSTKVKVVKEISPELKANVHPNPFNQVITISFSEAMQHPILVTIFDVNAKLIYSENFSAIQRLQLNLSDFSDGIYMLKVLSDTQFFNTKLIKI